MADLINDGANPAATQGSGVGGKTWTPQVTNPTGATYSAGDCIGGVLVVEQALLSWTGMLASLVVADKSGQAPALTVYIFRDEMSNNYLNGEPVELETQDAINCLCAFSFVADDDWVTGVSTRSIGTKACGGIALSTAKEKMLWVVIVSDGAYTFSAGDIVVTLGTSQD